MFDYEQRVTVRLLEWFQAGMCERCQVRNCHCAMPMGTCVQGILRMHSGAHSNVQCMPLTVKVPL